MIHYYRLLSKNRRVVINDYRDIWNYIEGNPGKWAEDKLYILPR